MTKVDHKEIGRKLKLFSFSRKVPGMVYWWPKGNILFNLIVNDLKAQLEKEGYQDLKTPTIIDSETLDKSGHFDNYREKLFLTGNEKEIESKKVKWSLKPMNCPGSIIIFNEEMRSYKDLPLKFSEVGIVYRYEQPGEVNGLFRTRGLTIDDAHIYCTEDQMEEEIVELIDFIFKTYEVYGFDDIRIELSTRPEKSIGTDEQWKKSEAGLKKALSDRKIDYKENPGEGAFYGPKIDFHIKDSIGRSWQLGTIQLDFATGERLDANYIDRAGKKKNPVIIHRAILGSVERFIGILLEHFADGLPIWLSPVQVVVASISDKLANYSKDVYDRVKKEGIRCELDDRDESISKKVRDAELQKIPYILVVGEKEKETGKVAVRDRSGDQGQKDLNQFIKYIKAEINSKN